jgi:hypothetical protein
MNFKKSLLESRLDSGYDLDFSQVFEKSFEIYKKMFAQAGVAVLLFIILSVIVQFTLMTVIFEINFLEISEVGFQLQNQDELKVLLFLVLTTVNAGLIAPMIAGILLLCKQAHLNEAVQISSIFELYNTSHFKEIFIFSTLLSLFGSLSSLGFEALELSYLSFLLQPLMYVFTFLVTPLIVFQNLNTFQAISASFNLVRRKFFVILGLMIVGALASILGFFAICVGIFFTIPFFYCIQFSVYESIIPIEKVNELDFIGQQDDEV